MCVIRVCQVDVLMIWLGVCFCPFSHSTSNILIFSFTISGLLTLIKTRDIGLNKPWCTGEGLCSVFYFWGPTIDPLPLCCWPSRKTFKCHYHILSQMAGCTQASKLLIIHIKKVNVVGPFWTWRHEYIIWGEMVKGKSLLNLSATQYTLSSHNDSVNYKLIDFCGCVGLRKLGKATFWSIFSNKKQFYELN